MQKLIILISVWSNRFSDRRIREKRLYLTPARDALTSSNWKFGSFAWIECIFGNEKSDRVGRHIFANVFVCAKWKTTKQSERKLLSQMILLKFHLIFSHSNRSIRSQLKNRKVAKTKEMVYFVMKWKIVTATKLFSITEWLSH